MNPYDNRSILHLLQATELLSDADEADIADLQDEIRPLAVEAGHTLFREGDQSDSMYLLVQGRAAAILEDGPTSRLLGVISAGEFIGELGALTGETRSSTVRMSRDSILLEISVDGFKRLASRNPNVCRHLNEMLISRLRSTIQRTRKHQEPAVIVLAIGSTGVSVQEVCRRLVSSLEKHGEVVTADYKGLSVSGAIEDDQGFNKWLSEKEQQARYVVLLAEEPGSSWTRFCLRQADEIVVVVRNHSGAKPIILDRCLSTESEGSFTPRRNLLLIESDDCVLPSGSRRWFDLFRVERHLHVRSGIQTDFERFARLLTGRSVALALGGGAARGAAHLGVLKALEEEGVPVDIVCGTSVGAIVSAIYAMDWDLDRIEKSSHSALVKGGVFFHFTLPAVSMLNSGLLRRGLRRLFGDADVEDLWLPFFCIATNLTRASTVVLNKGPVVDVVLASSSIPGIFPPINCDGELIVDGAILNNLPADEALRQGAGFSIAVNLIPAVDASISASKNNVKSQLRMLMNRLNPFYPDRQPLLPEIAARSLFVPAIAQAEQIKKAADLYIELPVGKFSFFNIFAFKQLMRIGYDVTRKHLKDFPGPAFWK